MNTSDLLIAIDTEIATLTQARNLLAGGAGTGVGNGRVGRPVKKRTGMSAEARARMAAGQRKRWAKQKSAKKSAV